MHILMLGNSLTSANDLPTLLAERLQADVVAHTRGGARLSEHLNPETKLGKSTQQALANARWDYVVMQEMSNGPVRFRARFVESVASLSKAIRAAGAKPIVYATWAYAPGCPKLARLGLSHDQMFEEMLRAHAEAASQSGALLADACRAFYDHPRKRELYATDGVHPSRMGTELALETIASAIEEPSAVPYTVYLLQCEDGSYYTGITTDVERRFQEHLSRGPKAARYTRTHPVQAIAATWEAPNRAKASQWEYRIKQLTHEQKSQLANNPEQKARFIGQEDPE